MKHALYKSENRNVQNDDINFAISLYIKTGHIQFYKVIFRCISSNPAIILSLLQML